MATRKKKDSRTYTGSPDELPPTADDPGGSRAKGYSADPDQVLVEVQEPVPLAPDNAVHGHVKKPDQSHAVAPPADR